MLDLVSIGDLFDAAKVELESAGCTVYVASLQKQSSHSFKP